MITASPWLLTLAKQGEPHRRVAETILRMSAVIPNRTGHLPDIGSEYARRKITGSARYGHVADMMVPCTKCGTQARLSYWCTLASLDRAQLEFLRSDARLKALPEEVAYCYRCPGEAYRKALDAIESLPAPRRAPCE